MTPAVTVEALDRAGVYEFASQVRRHLAHGRFKIIKASGITSGQDVLALPDLDGFVCLIIRRIGRTVPVCPGCGLAGGTVARRALRRGPLLAG